MPPPASTSLPAALAPICIMVATAVTLNQHGITNIQTSAQAAEALRPVAGEFAFAVFALGIIGTGLLAVPVLAGSAAYAVSEVFGWRSGLSHGFREARGFYLIIIAATVIGAVMGAVAIDPIKARVRSAIVNGVISVPIMVVISMDRAIQAADGRADHQHPPPLFWLGGDRGDGLGSGLHGGDPLLNLDCRHERQQQPRS